MSLFYESLKIGLEEAIAYEKGNKSVGRSQIISIAPVPEYKKDDVKNIRINLGLTQRNFAMIVGVSYKTVEAWESGKNTPSGSSSRLLQFLEIGGKDFLMKYNVLLPQNSL